MGMEVNNMKVRIESPIGIGAPVERDYDEKTKAQQVLEEMASIQGVSKGVGVLVKGEKDLDTGKSLKQNGVKDGDELLFLPKGRKGGATIADLAPRTADRIRREIVRINHEGLPIQFEDALTLKALIPGHGRWPGDHPVSMRLPPDYPTRPPLGRFTERLVPDHPNVGRDGIICHSILGAHWSPVYNLNTVWHCLRELLAKPNYHHPLNFHAQPPLLGW